MSNNTSSSSRSKKIGYSDNLLYTAVARGDVEGAKKALMKGFMRKPANPNVIIDDPLHPLSLRTLLSMAFFRGDLTLVELLLSHGADPKLQSSLRGVSAISDLITESKSDRDVCERGSMNLGAKSLEKIIHHGFNFEKSNQESSTPAWLQMAILKDNIGLVDLLLKNGVARGDCERLGPASLLAVNTSARMTEFLASQGFDMTGKRHEKGVGGSPLLHVLLRAGAPDAKRSEGDLYQTIQVLLAKGAKVNYKTLNSGFSPLMLAADLKNHPEQAALINLLVQSGADVNDQDTYGKTALMHAIEKFNEKAANDLINISDLEICDEKGRNALDIVKWIQEEHKTKQFSYEVGSLEFLKRIQKKITDLHKLDLVARELKKQKKTSIANSKSEDRSNSANKHEITPIEKKSVELEKSDLVLEKKFIKTNEALDVNDVSLGSFSKMVKQLESWLDQEAETKMLYRPTRQLMRSIHPDEGFCPGPKVR